MKKYPRIYSLSTVGIIHHQENDYIFHPARTDFIGDSGSGKSIITDLLQLIFVGASAFRSATIPVQGKREPDGLVLRSPGKSLDYGYAFVNIDVDLYKPLLAGLEYFWPRMAENGYIFVHDYFSFSYAIILTRAKTKASIKIIVKREVQS